MTTPQTARVTGRKSPKHDDDDRLMSAKQVAANTSLSVRYIRQLAYDDVLPTVKVGRRRLFYKSGVDAFIAAHAAPGA